jgi:hypothetical protein
VRLYIYFSRISLYCHIVTRGATVNDTKTNKTEKTSKVKQKIPKTKEKNKRKTLNNTVNVRWRRWATVKPQSCISSSKGNSAPLEDVAGGFRGRYAQPLP